METGGQTRWGQWITQLGIVCTEITFPQQLHYTTDLVLNAQPFPDRTSLALVKMNNFSPIAKYTRNINTASDEAAVYIILNLML